MNKQAPCKDCERRGCGNYHDQCEKYQEFLRVHKDTKKLEKTDKMIRGHKRKYQY